MSRKLQRHCGRRGFSVPTIGVFLLGVIVASGTAQAVNRTSAAPGTGKAWNDPSAWVPAGAPTAADILTIRTGDRIFTNNLGVATPGNIAATRIIVQPGGQLLSDSFPGFGSNLTVTATRIDVSAGGVIAAQDGFASVTPGGSLTLTGANLTVINHGEIRGGMGSNGGNVTITSSGATATYAGSGRVLAGAGVDPFVDGYAGNTNLYMRDIVMQNAGTVEPLIRGGDTDNDLRCAGSVRLYARNTAVVAGINSASGANVAGGDNISPTSVCKGGMYYLRGSQNLVVQAGALVRAGLAGVNSGCTWSGTSCGCNVLFTCCNASVIAGTVLNACQYEPPELSLEGEGRLEGDRIQISGEDFIARNLVPGAGVFATDRIEFVLLPGGTMDLSQLDPSRQWFSAPNGISIAADPGAVTLPAGGSFLTMMGQQPQMLPAGASYAVCVTPGDQAESVRAGEQRQVPILVTNCGSGTDTYTISISDSGGWLSNPSGATPTLAIGDDYAYTLNVAVPANVAPGSSSTVTVQVQSQTRPQVQETVSIAYSVPRPLCIADMDDGSGTGTPDGGITIDDLLYYLVIFEAGDIRSDVDDGSGTGTRDNGVTIDDLLYYLVRFEAGC